jgi:hypothetical protein
MRRHFQIFGCNKREFAASLWIGIFGSLMWLLIDSQRQFVHDGPPLQNLLGEWRHHVGFIAVAVISWLCALNAWRDSSNSQTNRRCTVVWMFILTVWIGFRLLWFHSWRQALLF